VTIQAGLNKETRFVSFGAGLADFDNDGFPDLLITTGTVYPELDRVDPRFPARSPRILFRNRGDGTFVQLGAETGPGIEARHCSRGAAFGDFDNDGDMDVLIMNVNEPPTLLRNDVPPNNHWIKIRLEGTKSNRSAIGARVLVRYGGKVQVQEVQIGCSFLLARSAPALWNRRRDQRGHRDPLAARRDRKVCRPCRRPTRRHPGRPGYRERSALPLAHLASLAWIKR
jgi:hypothetical protein